MVKIRSDLIHLRYNVEGKNRPDSYGESWSQTDVLLY
jgi:hypothetical protein